MNEMDYNGSCSMVFSSSIDDWTDMNSSFDKGVLRVAYHGANNNHTFISKDAFDDAIKSMFNCPVVCNYIRDTDSIGAHDIDIVNHDGEPRMVNVTTPVGVVPESANVWWSEVMEDDGEVHEYLCADILIWKRQEAYEHIKKNGITDESMEIRIINGSKNDDGFYHIDRFEFIAFCLLESAPPCFESASIELFTLNDFEAKYAQMIEDVKREFPTVIAALADDTQIQSFSKGGICELDVNELMIQYSLSAEDITFDTSNMELEEIERKFAEIKAAKDEASGTAEPTSDPDNGSQNGEDNQNGQMYSLTASQFMSELYDALDTVKYTDPYWGELCRYGFVDYDATLNEVYVVDMEDYKLYGMAYSMNGDRVVVDFASCRRKKVCYSDFDNGEEAFSDNNVFGNLIPKLQDKFQTLGDEARTLRDYKAEIDEQNRKDENERVFAQFSDLEDNVEFKSLRENNDGLSAAQIEEKCFAIRGRGMSAKFSLDPQTKPIRLPVEEQVAQNADEPYGGVFVRYGIGNK